MGSREVLGQHYAPRVIDTALRRALESAGAVVLEGARASGKTMTALHAARSHVFIDDAETQSLLDVAPRAVLEGERPRLLDEWQLAPELWNMVRRAVDASEQTGQFILTGSAVPADDITRHTGAGRFVRLRQRTMTWWERDEGSSGAVSIAALLRGERPDTDLGQRRPLEVVVRDVLRAGFPAMRGLDPGPAAARLRAYVDDVARTDIHRLGEVRHTPDVILRVLTSLARSTAAEVTFRTVAADVRGLAPSITAETVSDYVGHLQRLFVVERQEPWAPELRSRARLRRSPKFHLVDPALAAALLGAGPERLSRDLETLGMLFESAVVHDLMVFASALGGEVRHYRDSNGKEIDAVVTVPDGRWLAVGIKLGEGQLQTAVESLRSAVDEVDTSVVGEPVCRLVITGTGPVLVADDGTVTAPLHALMP